MQTGILDKTRLVSNVLMLVLLCGNIYFSIQYTHNIQEERDTRVATEAKNTERLQIARFLKFFVDTVLKTDHVITQDERFKLEGDVRQLQDESILGLWNEYSNSKDGKSAQVVVVKLLSILSSKML